jgi:predicted nucleotide-binding protein
LIERYDGPDGRRLFVEALRSQPFVEGSIEIATALADHAVLEEVPAGQTLMVQGGDDNDLALVVSGSVDITINKRKVAERSSGQHVGEMAMIDPSARRSATVTATQRTVIARISETRFTEIANKHPRIWRHLAKELGSRLRERSKFIKLPNDKSQIFIGSSREALPVAEAISEGFDAETRVVRIWTHGVFEASRTSIEALEKMAQGVDFAVLVFSPDDTVFSRGTEMLAPRDNIIFELGLAIGSLGRDRSFIVLPRGSDLKVPTDLLGVTPIHYEADKEKTVAEQLKPVCEVLTPIVGTMGPK